MKIEQKRKNHEELLWALSDGSKTDMDAWNASDVMEVLRGLEMHEKRVKRMLETTKGKNDGDHSVRRARGRPSEGGQ